MRVRRGASAPVRPCTTSLTALQRELELMGPGAMMVMLPIAA